MRKRFKYAIYCRAKRNKVVSIKETGVSFDEDGFSVDLTGRKYLAKALIQSLPGATEVLIYPRDENHPNGRLEWLNTNEGDVVGTIDALRVGLMPPDEEIEEFVPEGFDPEPKPEPEPEVLPENRDYVDKILRDSLEKLVLNAVEKELEKNKDDPVEDESIKDHSVFAEEPSDVLVEESSEEGIEDSFKDEVVKKEESSKDNISDVEDKDSLKDKVSVEDRDSSKDEVSVEYKDSLKKSSVKKLTKEAPRKISSSKKKVKKKPVPRKKKDE